MSPLEWYQHQTESGAGAPSSSPETGAATPDAREDHRKTPIIPEATSGTPREILEKSPRIPEKSLFESSEGDIFFGDEEEGEKNIGDEGRETGGLGASRGNTGVFRGIVEENDVALGETQGNPLTRDDLPWVDLAEQVLTGRFEGADRSTRDSLRLGMRSLNHPTVRRAVEHLCHQEAQTKRNRKEHE